jgi:hypothetical protein
VVIVNPYDFYITPEEYAQAAKNGIRPALLEVRIRSLGWPKQRAITEPPQQKKPRIPREIVEMAERNGITYNTLRWRVHTLGWDMERAATQPLQDRKAQAKRAYEARRKYPAHYKRMAEENGIKESTFHSRLRSGWDIETAATRPPMTGREVGLMTKDKRSRGLEKIFRRR